MPSRLATSGTEAPAANSASASRSLRTICSGVCLLFIESPPFARLGPSDSHSSRISFRGAGQAGLGNNLRRRVVQQGAVLYHAGGRDRRGGAQTVQETDPVRRASPLRMGCRPRASGRRHSCAPRTGGGRAARDKEQPRAVYRGVEVLGAFGGRHLAVRAMRGSDGATFLQETLG